MTEFSDEEILKIPDTEFACTLAYRYFGDKHLFTQKIKDKTIRQKMLRKV
jgi:hypothetical protein